MQYESGSDTHRPADEPPDSSSTSRGQMMAMSGLILLLLFVFLTLVLNAAAGTASTATTTSFDHFDATDHVDAAGQHARGELRAVNDASLNATQRTDRATARIDARGVAGRDFAARNGYDATVSVNATANGTRITQSDSRNFTDADGASDWTLTTEADGLRAFRITVLNESLVGALGLSESFYVRLADDHGDTRLVYITQNGGDIAVQVDDGDGPSDEDRCRIDAASAVVDITAGTVGGERCGPLVASPPLSGPLTIEFQNAVDAVWGDTARGTYELTANRTEADLLADHGGAYTTDGDGPATTDVLYSVTLDIHYRDRSVIYEAEREIAPEPLRERDT